MAVDRQRSHRYAAVDAYSPSPSFENPGRALVKARPADIVSTKDRNNLGTMVRKFMEKRSNVKSGSAGRTTLAVPAFLGEADEKKGKKEGGLSSLSKKLFQKGGGNGSGSGKALTEVKTNTRTLGMVLRSERELLNQNKEYEELISELKLLLEDKNREAEKLKDLCLKQREEIKALKDAILFPDIMNSQLQDLLAKQGSELRQANQVIPRLQKQVTSLTGQLRCLADDLAEVKADKYTSKLFYDEDPSSPRTPTFIQDAADSLKHSSGPKVSDYNSSDEMFLKDFNPCLTPISNIKSKECDKMFFHNEGLQNGSITDFSPEIPKGSVTDLSPGIFSGPHGGILSRSSEHRHRPSLGSSSRKICRSDENKWSTGKPKYKNMI